MKRKLQFKRILACSIVLLLMLFVMPGLTSNVMAASDGTGITETIDINLSYKMDKIHSGAQDYYSRNPGKDIYGGVYYENGKIALQGNLKDGEIIDYFYIFQRNGMLKYKYNNYEVLKVNEDNLLLEPIKIESEIQEFKICLSQLIKIEDYNIKE